MRRHFFVVVLVVAIAVVALYTAETNAYSLRTGASAEGTAMPRLSNGHPDLNGY